MISSASSRTGLIANHLAPHSHHTMDGKSLADKVAIVSGSSSGIGAAIIRELSSRGANTVVNYPFAHLKNEADSLVASLPSLSIAVEADMSLATSPQKLVDAAVSKWGRIDIVVNCVALAVNKPFESQTLEDWDLLVNTNGRINAVSPGPTKTEGFSAAGEEQMKILQPIIDQTPVGPRMAEPEEIAFAVAFLCEERARWINGAHIVASGGLFID
ncbi:unnamed protein product [Aspergillus oryzae]|nr:unnamed protein product [Aspergillus oryzae]GMF90109.1 unnamed protein product [Aspergillus oryzae]